MKLTSVLTAIKYVWQAKKIWAKPRVASVLIYDREGSVDFTDYLDFNNVEIFECRGESINIIVLLLSFYKFGLKINFERYAGQYLATVSPLVVLTFIDNTITFYQLKKYFHKAKFISIQNGYRDNCLFKTLLEDSKKDELLEADAILCFGTAIGQEYTKHITSEILPLGSFKNNKIHKNKKPKNISEILFISQYRTPVWHNGNPTMPVGSRHILWDDFYSTESHLLPCLLSFCKANGYDLKVCGTSFNENREEESYFISLLGEDGWSYIKKNSHLGSYERLDEAACVVFIDSTLGYEALGRGVKAIAFPARGKALEADDRGFGWPANLSDTGPFWANNFDESIVEGLLEYITSVSDKDWQETSQKIIPKIMGYDQGNIGFIHLLNDFGVSVKSSK
jgi:surface carbohydrate biosynthesis protein